MIYLMLVECFEKICWNVPQIRIKMSSSIRSVMMYDLHSTCGMVSSLQFKHCMETQERIDNAMAHIRSVGFTITPKLYGIESHMVTQCPKRRRFLGYVDLTRASAVERKHGCRISK